MIEYKHGRSIPWENNKRGEKYELGIEHSSGANSTHLLTPQNTKEEWEKDLDAILDGIDKDECEYEHGWWETSTGAEFGAKKKVELKALISNLLRSQKQSIMDMCGRNQIEPIPEANGDDITEYMLGYNTACSDLKERISKEI